jgi:hypothetical protein
LKPPDYGLVSCCYPRTRWQGKVLGHRLRMVLWWNAAFPPNSRECAFQVAFLAPFLADNSIILNMDQLESAESESLLAGESPLTLEKCIYTFVYKDKSQTVMGLAPSSHQVLCCFRSRFSPLSSRCSLILPVHRSTAQRTHTRWCESCTRS